MSKRSLDSLFLQRDQFLSKGFLEGCVHIRVEDDTDTDEFLFTPQIAIEYQYIHFATL